MMKNNMTIQHFNIEHVERYGEIYAAAFSGEPWKDYWTIENAAIHVRELSESRTAYGLECIIDREIAGFILGSSMLFSYGRAFEIHDLAVDPTFQHRGIAKQLMNRLLSDVKEQGMVGVHLITAREGNLPAFYEKFGFSKEKRVLLMGLEL